MYHSSKTIKPTRSKYPSEVNYSENSKVRKMSDLFSYVRKERDQLVSSSKTFVTLFIFCHPRSTSVTIMVHNLWHNFDIIYDFILWPYLRHNLCSAYMSLLFLKFGYTRKFSRTMSMFGVTQVYSLRLFDTMDYLRE